MKKYFKLLFVLMIGVFILIGCNKENNVKDNTKKEEKEEVSLVGTWVYEDAEGGYSATYVFMEDGSGTYTMSGAGENVSQSIKYRFDETKIYIIYEDEEEEFEEIYRFENGNLILRDAFEEEYTYIKRR